MKFTTKWYAIEHTTRGMFKRMDRDAATGTPKPRFSLVASRTDEVVKKFYHVAKAQQTIMEMPRRIGDDCYIIEMMKKDSWQWPQVRRLPVKVNTQTPKRSES